LHADPIFGFASHDTTELGTKKLFGPNSSASPHAAVARVLP
jgi:hypothetical protein